MKKSASSGN